MSKKILALRKTVFALMFLMIMLSACRPKDLHDQILDFCRDHDTIILSDVTEFDWTVAYIDRQHYMNGEGLKENFGIEGEFKSLPTDFSTRIAFCKDNILVYDLIINDFYFEIDSSLDTIAPDSKFLVEWAQIDESSDDKLSLILN